MSKAVMISIQPWWCELIAQGKKTIEVRKTKPKLETPFKCYIYCTKKDNMGLLFPTPLLILNERVCNSKVIGEFTCNSISEYEAEFHTENDSYQDIREIFRDPDDTDDDCRDYSILTSNDEDNPNDCDFCKRTCLTFEEVKAYIGEECFCKTFYGWHISELSIYDKPKELRDFRKVNVCPCSAKSILHCTDNMSFCAKCNLTRPPQSWCYVEEVSE